MDLINILFAKALSNRNTDKEYVDEAIKALKGKVSADLDTLEELSKALGNDPDFFLSIKNELDNKITKDEFNSAIANLVSISNYNPIDKTGSMTQPVGKDADGKLWTAPGAVQTVNGEAPDENGNVQVSGLPDGASANQQLVTDKEGIAKWEEKPFYTTQDTEVITWDGDTAGREEVSLGDFSFYKISDTFYPPEGIIGSTFTIMRNGVPEDIVITDEMFMDLSSNAPGTWFVKYDGAPVLGSGPALEGVYYLKTDTFYVSSLSLVSTVLKEIDPIYIPAIPADKLPEIPAEKLPEIPAEKLPFVEQKTFEGSFDKVTDGRDKFKWNDFNYYKFSEFSPRREDVISFSGTRASGDTISHINEGKNCCEYGLFIVVYKSGQCTLAVNSTTQYSFNAPSAGLYARYETGNDSQTAGTYNFTLRLVRNMVQSSTTFKRYYLDVDDSGIPTFTDTSDSTNTWTPTDELPTVTSEDAGKFLRVSSAGTWVAESIPNAEEASF